MRKGVILGGGEGKRLGLPYNKHIAPVYDRPMIYYPLQSLKEMGCDSAIVVSGPKGLPQVAEAVGDGSIVGLDVTYKMQPTEAGGTAEALATAKNGLTGVFPVLCGDVYFDPAPPRSDVPALIYNQYERANEHAVWNPETNEIIEKPIRDIGKRAIVAYWFDERVFDFIRDMKPSERGELELVDIYRFYLENGAEMIEHQGFFGDMGTPDGLLRVANYVKEKQ